MLAEVGPLSSESVLYILYVNIKALHAADNAFYELLDETWMSMNERVTQFLRFFLHNFLPQPLALWAYVVVIGSCGGTDSGT